MIGAMTAAESARTDLAALLRAAPPPQGAWSDEDYLWLTDRGGRLVEFTDGHLRELPMPTFTHQAVLLFFYRLLHDWLAPRGGVAMAALPRRAGAGMRPPWPRDARPNPTLRRRPIGTRRAARSPPPTR